MSTSQPNEDLFEESRMSFGQHLEELRKVLIRALMGVAVACVVGFIFAHDVVQFLERPLLNATKNFRVAEARQRLLDENGFVDPEMEFWFNKERMIPQQVHVDPGELVRLLRSVSPNSFADVELNPYGFQASHFAADKLTKFCEAFAEQQTTESDDVKQINYLWGLLTDDEKVAVQSISVKATANENDVEQMVTICNRLIELKLYDAQEFQSALAPPESGYWSWLNPPDPNPLVDIKKSLDEKHDPDLAHRLNRVLITRLFITHVPQVRLGLLPLNVWENAEIKPQSLTATEPFMIWIKAGVISGLLLASPWVLLQLWMFVATGLYKHEKKYVYVFLPISLFLFFAGASLAFFFVFEPVLSFLFTFNAQMGIMPQIRINDWLSFVMFLPLGFGIAFQLPLVMLFLNRINVFTVEVYLNKWRIAVMVIFVLAMVLTPADPISMILLAMPLTVLYFLGILLCRWFPGQQNPFEELPEPAEA